MPSFERTQTRSDGPTTGRSSLLLLRDARQPSLLTACRDRRGTRWLASARSCSLDRQLAEGHAPEASRLLAARAYQLVRPRMRHALAQGWRTVLVRAGRAPGGRSSRVALPRQSIEACESEIRAMVDALTRGAPLPVRGVATASWLLTDGSGPLYQCGQPEELRAVLRRASVQLDPSTPL